MHHLFDLYTVRFICVLGLVQYASFFLNFLACPAQETVVSQSLVLLHHFSNTQVFSVSTKPLPYLIDRDD